MVIEIQKLYSPQRRKERRGIMFIFLAPDPPEADRKGRKENITCPSGKII
jgi:hypothetical protein